MIIFNWLKSFRKLVLYKIFRLKTFGVRIILKKDEKVLLIKHPYDDFWVFPGGGIKKGEHEISAAERELKEETGYILNNSKILGIYENFSGGKNDYVTAVFSDDFSESDNRKNIIDQIEIEKQAWFGVNNLPKTSSATKRRVDEVLSGDFSESVRKW